MKVCFFQLRRGSWCDVWLQNVDMGFCAAWAQIGGTPNPARDEFYTICSRDHDAADELLEAAPPQAMPDAALAVDESRYFEELKAVTDQAGSMYGPVSHGPPHRNYHDAHVAGQGSASKICQTSASYA